MTRISKIPPKKSVKVRAKARPGYWVLQDAKARFSELVRRAQSDGPQHVTLHAREAVVVIAADEYRRLSGEPTGQALVEVIQASPHRDFEIAPPLRDARGRSGPDAAAVLARAHQRV